LRADQKEIDGAALRGERDALAKPAGVSRRDGLGRSSTKLVCCQVESSKFGAA
jgi:hypothetical protein